MTKPPPLFGRLAIVAAYTLVFWGVLPAVLWWVGARLDVALQARWGGSALGAGPTVLGAWLLFRSIRALWQRGGGLPISALPPPHLVIVGPYQWMRHPIYVGFNLAVLGVALLVGSPGLLLVSIGFLPLWLAYARFEERGLARRFGRDWGRYTRTVGVFPSFSIVWVARLLAVIGRIRVRIEGAEHLPRTGPAVLVANHACYTDPVLLTLLTRRTVWFPTTAEAYRPGGIMAWASRHYPAFPVRRYRVDAPAMREMLALLGQGEIIGLFPERERSVLGRFLGPDAENAAVLSRLGVPVIPVGLDGNYDCGPRWARKLALKVEVTALIGSPVDWRAGTPAEALDRAMRGVLGEDPQRVDLARWPLERLSTAVWCCPACGDEAGWRPAELACTNCDGRWEASGDGRVRDSGGGVQAFADWAEGAWRHRDGPLELEARVLAERDGFGEIDPLVPVHEGTVHLGPDGIRFGEATVALPTLRSVTTERADTLQIATSTEMWQIVAPGWSAFRLQLAVKRWMPRRPPPARVARAASVASSAGRSQGVRPSGAGEISRWPVAGAAVGLGFAVVEAASIVVPIANAFGAAGFWRTMLPSTLAWVGLGALVDVLVGLGSRSPWVRGGAVVAAFAGIALAAAQPPLAIALVVGGGTLWALALRFPVLDALAWCVAVWALSPILPRPVPPLAPEPSVRTSHVPDIAVIVLDTLPFGRTSLGREDGRDTTPNLRALAERGTLFVNARSPSCWSLPAHASILTGRWPADHGADYENLRLNPEVPTLPEILGGEVGYETAAFTANPLVAPGVGLGRGFEVFEERWRRYTLQDALFAWRLLNRWTARDRDKQGSEVVQAFRDWHAHRDGRQPFFAFVNLFEAHVPWQEIPLEHRGRWTGATPRELEELGEITHLAQTMGTPVPDAIRDRAIDMHDEAIAAADDHLGEILGILGEETLIFVVSDHGEAYGERGYWGHNLGLGDELLRVPLVMAGPGVLERGLVYSPVSLIDVFPTVLAQVDQPGPEVPGENLFERMAPRPPSSLSPPPRRLRAEHGRTDLFTSGWQLMHPFADHAALRARRWSVTLGSRKRSVVEGVSDVSFDLIGDPGEDHPLPPEAAGFAAQSPWEGR